MALASIFCAISVGVRLLSLATYDGLPRGFNSVLDMCTDVCFTHPSPPMIPPSPPPPLPPPLCPPFPPPPMSPCKYPSTFSYLCRPVDWGGVGCHGLQCLGPNWLPSFSTSNQSIAKDPMTCSTGPKFLYCDMPIELFAVLGLSATSLVLSYAEWERGQHRHGPLAAVVRRGSQRFQVVVDVVLFCVDMASMALILHVAIMTSIWLRRVEGDGKLMHTSKDDTNMTETILVSTWVNSLITLVCFLLAHFSVGHWSALDQADGIGQYLLPKTMIERRWRRIHTKHEARFRARYEKWASREALRRISSTSEAPGLSMSMPLNLSSGCTQDTRPAHTMVMPEPASLAERERERQECECVAVTERTPGLCGGTPV